MSEQNKKQSPTTDNALQGATGTQAYLLAAFCLVLGVALGYLFRGSASPAAQPAVAAAVQQDNGSAKTGAEALAAVAQAATQTAPGATKQAAPSVIRVRGGDLWYSDAERRATMHGGILSAVTTETGTATTVSNDVELELTPAGAHASGQTQVERMTATGRVVVSSQGRRGTGEQLVYTGADGNYVLTGTAETPPKMTDPERGSVTGQALIFHSRDDSVSIEGGPQETRTETTAPK